MNGLKSLTPNLNFTADIPRQYQVLLVAKNSLNICRGSVINFGVTWNKACKGKTLPRLANIEIFDQLKAIDAVQAWKHTMGNGVTIAVVLVFRQLYNILTGDLDKQACRMGIKNGLILE